MRPGCPLHRLPTGSSLALALVQASGQSRSGQQGGALLHGASPDRVGSSATGVLTAQGAPGREAGQALPLRQGPSVDTQDRASQDGHEGPTFT